MNQHQNNFHAALRPIKMLSIAFGFAKFTPSLSLSFSLPFSCHAGRDTAPATGLPPVARPRLLINTRLAR